MIYFIMKYINFIICSNVSTDFVILYLSVRISIYNKLSSALVSNINIKFAY